MNSFHLSEEIKRSSYALFINTKKKTSHHTIYYICQYFFTPGLLLRNIVIKG